MPELPPLLRNPAAGMSLNEWLYAVMVSLLLRGNAYGIVTGGTVAYRLNGEELAPADVWHVRAYTFPGTVLGLSPVEYARQTIGLGLAAEKFGGQFFGDGSVPSGVIYADRDPGREGAKKLQAEWVEARRDNRKPAVLAGARFEPLTVKPEESQFLGTIDANRNAIASLYGVPPEMVGGTTAGPLAYTSPEMRSLDLLVYTVRGWLVRLENAITTLPPSTQVARFNAARHGPRRPEITLRSPRNRPPGRVPHHRRGRGARGPRAAPRRCRRMILHREFTSALQLRETATGAPSTARCCRGEWKPACSTVAAWSWRCSSAAPWPAPSPAGFR